MRQKQTKAVVWAGLILLAQVGVHADVKVERSPLGVGGYIDVGQVVKGAVDQGGHNPDGEMKVLQHTGVYFSQNTTINDRLDIKVGVGALFFYGYPDVGSLVSRVVKLVPGVGQAEGVYTFGDLQAPSWIMQFGFFPYKYNPDAKNLGEYLLRSGTYPGYEVTGGWSTINSALYMASGLSIRGNFLSNTLVADFNMFLERDIEPQHDFSPSVVLTYKPTPVFEVGAGVEFAHLIPTDSRKLKSTAFSYRGDSAFVGNDSGNTSYTFQGTKVMGRASVNLGAMLNNPWIGKEGLKLYGEAAILGIKNYPYYYEKRSKRIPVMVGINLPTLNFFDVLAFEVEHRDWDFQNNIKNAKSGEPVWGNANQAPGTGYDPNHPGKLDTSDAVKAQGDKWSFYAKKQQSYHTMPLDLSPFCGDSNFLYTSETSRPCRAGIF